MFRTEPFRLVHGSINESPRRQSVVPRRVQNSGTIEWPRVKSRIRGTGRLTKLANSISN